MLSDLEYIRLFDSCTISPSRVPELNLIIDNNILANRHRYEVPGTKLTGLELNAWRRPTGSSSRPASAYRHSSFQNTALFSTQRQTSAINQMPWYVLACLECARTDSGRHKINPGRLLNSLGEPRAEHNDSASSRLSQLPNVTGNTVTGKHQGARSWTLANILRFLEKDPGLSETLSTGSRLWSGSNHEQQIGRLASPWPGDRQPGPAVILKGLENRGIIYIPRY
ncbi:hypothetical protein [Pedobacter sp. SYP-B3415]|uniref:hypothetical protein n=1 Tax=Pedobacter sp. SYP-B3415 TaxID=2496641 RepID=UPI00101E0A9B|nr:hypothetical protein [Pedobacter sp. SYP-B3415]